MKKIKINDVELAYRDEGAGKPVIFLHAFPLNQTMWDGQVRALASSYRVVTFDWRGFGESEIGSKDSTMSVFADDLAQLFGRLNIKQATICGLSLGGYVAFAFFRKFKDKVNALILCDTRETSDTEESKKGRYQMAELAYNKGTSAIAEIMIPKLLGETTLRNCPEVVRQTRSMIEGARPEGIMQALRGMAQRSDSSDLLPLINIPTLIIVGNEDKLTPVSEAKRMSQAIARSQMEIIGSAGHLSNIEQMEKFNKAICCFLGTL